LYYFYDLLGLDRRTFVGSELPEYFFYTNLALIKWPVLLAWATSEPFQGCWANFECHWFKKIDANLHQFTLTKGGGTKIKVMQKAPSSGILHQLHQNYYKNFKICYKKHEICF
jgi:hypothetical protein